MFNKKRAFIICVFILLMFFLMTFGGSNGGDFIATRSVNFIDGITNNTISSQKVEVGKDAKVPEIPYHKGYVFTSWLNNDKKEVTTFTNITKDLTVTGTYKLDINNNGIADDIDTYYTVKFYDTIANKTIKSQKVLIGMNANAPLVPVHNGYTFAGWSRGYSNVKENITVNTVYTKEAIAEYFKVTFIDGDTNEVISTSSVKSGLTASLPEAPLHKYRIFSKWDGNYINVTKDETVIARYIDVISYNVTFVSGDHGSLNDAKKSLTFTDVKEGMTFKEGKVIIPSVKAEDGYTFTGFDTKVTNSTIVNGNMIITALYKANDDTKYTINYIKVKDGKETTETEVKEGTTDTSVTLSKDTLKDKYTGYTLDTDKSTFTGIITGDGKLVLNVYYNVNSYNVVIDPDNGNDPTNKEEEYGNEITLPEVNKSYTLTYEEHGVNPNDKVTRSAKLKGYCSKTSCTDSELIKAGTKVTVEKDVTYKAVWGNATSPITIKDGKDYQTNTTNYEFMNWRLDDTHAYDNGDELLLSKNEVVTAIYGETVRYYDVMVTYVINDNHGYTVPAKVSERLEYNKKYSYSTPTVVGYEADKNIVEGTVTADVNETVTYNPITYTLTYNMNLPTGITGASATPSSKEFKIYDNVLVNDVVSSVSHTFTGWYTESTNGTKVTSFTQKAQNVTVYAHWTINSYNVVIDPDNGNDPTNKEEEYGNEITLPEVNKSYTLTYEEHGVNPNDKVTRSAKLKGYCSKTSCTDSELIKAGTKVTVTNDVTYKAVWGDATSPITIKNGNNYYDKTLNKYYDFNTWKNGTNAYDAGSKLTLSGNLIITAAYTEKGSYNVVFNKGLHGKISTPSEFANIKGGLTFAEGKIIVPTVTANAGYTFTGWDKPVLNTTIVNGNVTITALYKANDDTKYTINYIKVKDGKETTETEVKEGTTDTSVTLSKDTLKDKYTGYTLDTDKSTFTGIITGDGKLVLNVYYNVNSYVVEIDPNNGDDPTKDNHEYGDTFTLGSASKAYTLSYKVKVNEDDGTETAAFSFNGWCKDNDCSKIYHKGDVVTVEDNVKYTANYSASPAELTIKAGEAYENTEDDILYVYSFTKWTLDHNTLEYTKSDYVSGDKITLLGDTTLKAIYEKSAKTFKLNIEYIYEDLSTASPVYSVMTPNGSSYSVTSPNVNGYTPSLSIVSGIMPKSDLNYKIIYKANNYKLSYDLNASDVLGVSAKPEDVTFNINTATFSVNAIATSTSHDFLGWFTAPTGGELVTSVNKGTYQNITVYAHWSKKNITTILDPNGGTLPDGTSDTTTNPYGTEITLPTATKSYSLSYKVKDNVADGSENADLRLIGWCKGTSTCTSPIAAGNKINATDNATYYAVWDVTSPTKTVKNSTDYTSINNNVEMVNKFTGWTLLENTLGYTKTDYVANDTITLLGNTTLKALYEANAKLYTLTIDYKYANGNVAHGSYSNNVANGLTYSVNSPAITGYTPDISIVTGTMPRENYNVLVTYNPNTNTPYKVLFYKDNVLQSNDTLTLNGTTDTTATFTPDNDKYDNYKLDSTASNVLSGNIAADGSLELKVYYIEKQANITVTTSRTINKADTSYTGNNLASNDTITYVVTLTNTGEGRGTVNIKDALIKSAIDNNIVTVLTDTNNIAGNLFSNAGLNVTVNSNQTITYTVTLKAIGKAGDSISSEVYVNNTSNESTKTYNIETKVTLNEISNVGSSVVLVLDNSMSMQDNNKLTNMKTAAKQFVSDILGTSQNPNNEVCVVVMPYDYRYTAKYQCSSNATTINNYINSKIHGSGLTPYEAAFDGALTAFSDLNSRHASNNKYTVFLSDGVPIDYSGHLEASSYYMDEAAELKSISTLYTIGYDIDGTDEQSVYARENLANIATTGKAYTASTTNLQTVFNEISTAINGAAHTTTTGKLNISSNLITTDDKNITIKVTHSDGTSTTITKTYNECITLGYIINNSGTYKFDASKFAAGDTINLTYYVTSI